jgi:death-on-curing protein
MVEGGGRRDVDTVRFYLSVKDVIGIHDRIVTADPDSDLGLRDRGDIEYVLEAIEHGTFGVVLETIHEKSFQPLRLLVANHPFVDGNKRTALGTAVVFYRLNGYELRYAEELESMVRLIALREDMVRPKPATEYLETRAHPVENEFEAIEHLFESYSADLQEFL